MKPIPLYFLFSAHLDDAADICRTIEAERVTADLGAMTRLFKGNFRSVMGEQYWTVPANGRSISIANRDLPVAREDVFLVDGQLAIPYRYNLFVVFCVMVDSPEEAAELRSQLVRDLSPDAASAKAGEVDLDRASALVDSAALSAMLSQSPDLLSVESWTPGQAVQSVELTGLLYTFFTAAGSAMVQLEINQQNIAISERGVENDSGFSEVLMRNRIFVTNYKRAVLSKSQSPVPELRARCEAIIEHYRMRDRIAWLEDVLHDMESIYNIVASRDRARSERRTGRILFALTAFTVLSGLFFGFFTLNSEALIAAKGPLALLNQAFFWPFIISLLALTLITIFVRLWPDRR